MSKLAQLGANIITSAKCFPLRGDGGALLVFRRQRGHGKWYGPTQEANENAYPESSWGWSE
jgi:hypothetical protein